MRKYLVESKSKIIKIVILVAIFFLVVGYLNGKKIYQEQKMMQLENQENSRA